MILGGAVGNLIDRLFYGVLYGDGPLFYGRVVDFLDVDFFNVNILGYHMSRWPVFNIADSAVTIGVLLLLIFHRSVGKEPENAPADPGPSAAGRIREHRNRS
jgi:signal peptidase II